MHFHLSVFSTYDGSGHNPILSQKRSVLLISELHRGLFAMPLLRIHLWHPSVSITAQK